MRLLKEASDKENIPWQMVVDVRVVKAVSEKSGEGLCRVYFHTSLP